MSLSHFPHPFDIARHPSFEPEVKRAILASWASDAAAGRTGLRPSQDTVAADAPTAPRSLDFGSRGVCR